MISHLTLDSRSGIVGYQESGKNVTELITKVSTYCGVVDSHVRLGSR